MQDTKIKTKRCQRHAPTTPLRVLTPPAPPKLTQGAAGVLLEMLREAPSASQDQEVAPDAA